MILHSWDFTLKLKHKYFSFFHYTHELSFFAKIRIDIMNTPFEIKHADIYQQLSKAFPNKVFIIPKKHIIWKSRKNNQKKVTNDTDMEFDDKTPFDQHMAFKASQKASLKAQREYKAKLLSEYFKHFDFNNKARVVQHIQHLPCNPFHAFYHKHTFDNQKQFGEIIQSHFSNKHILHTLAIAPTQSGKTGSMLSTCFHMLNHKDTYVPPQHIFVFTAHSSREWLLQTKQRFPDFMHDNIFHRPQASALLNKIKNKQNILLILDEAHIAAKPFQTLFNIFDKSRFFDFQFCYDNNIKILSFTATPNALPQHFTHSWKSSHVNTYMEVPESYKGIQQMIQNKRIFINKDLCGFDSDTLSVKPQTFTFIKEFLDIIDFKHSSPKFHIIRTHRALLHDITIQNFKHTLHTHFPHIHTSLISEPKQSFDFDSLQNKPPVHTFVFIVDKLRCAKSIHLYHVASLYDRFVQKPNFEAIRQGFIGRASGFYTHETPFCFSQFHTSMVPFKSSFAKPF